MSIFRCINVWLEGYLILVDNQRTINLFVLYQIEYLNFNDVVRGRHLHVVVFILLDVTIDIKVVELPVIFLHDWVLLLFTRDI